MQRNSSSKPKLEFESTDRISELPDSVIHAILSLLPRKDAVRTSVLSKRWNRVWETFPDLIFDLFAYTGTMNPQFSTEITPESIQQIGYVLDIAKRALLRSTRHSVGGIKFVLRTGAVSHELCSKLDECFKLALGSRVSEIDIRNWVPRGVPLPEIVFASNRFRCCSLRALSLRGIRLSEESIREIFFGCPNIRLLCLSDLSGLGKLDIRGLDRLESVSIVRFENQNVHIVDAPKLRIFHFTDYGIGISCTLSLTSCPGLRELNLERICIVDELFRSLFTLCPLLEDLVFTLCNMPRKVAISAKCLTRLVLQNCDEIEAVEIDTPALLSFKLQSESFPRLFLKSIPSQLEIVQTMSSNVPIHTSRFVDLRSFLAISTRKDCLKVVIYPEQVVFDREELRQVVFPPAFQLQHLKLEVQFGDTSFDKESLIDGLLWSCHPKTISVFLRHCEMSHSCVPVLSESLLEMEKNPTCCGSGQVKCWRHDLKSATAKRFEGSDAENPVIRFKLEWDSDSIW